MNRSTCLTLSRRLYLVLFFLCAFGPFAVAQSGAGIISGRVTDIDGTPLPGASVQLKGTSTGVASNQTGNYSFFGLNAGKHNIVVSYMGFDTKDTTVDLAAGQSLVLNFLLSTGKTGLRTVLVTASREGQAKALNQQRIADNIKQVISADLMGRFPDLNVAEALQRLPGVTIGRNKGEGATIQLRGTPGGFTNINVNGEQIMGTSESGERNASLDGYSVDVLSSMEVVKTLTPDLDGDAIAGVVNLKTPVAAGLKPRISADGGLGYNGLREKLNGIGNFSYGQRFFANAKNQNGALGLILNGSYYQTKNGYDALQAEVWELVKWNGGADSTYFPTDTRFIYYDATRIRKGASATLDYTFGPNANIVANVMYNNLNDENTRFRKRSRMRADSRLIREDDGTWTHSRGTAYSEAKDQVENTDNINYSLEGEVRTGKWKIDGGAFYTQSKFTNEAQSYNFITGRVPLELTDWNTDYIMMTGADWKNDASLYSFNTANGMEADYFNTKGSNVTGRMNFTLDYGQSGSGQLKFGAKYKRMKNQRWRPNEYASWDYTGAAADGALSNFIGSSNLSSDMLDGNFDFGYPVDRDKAKAFFEANRGTNFAMNTNTVRVSTDTYFYDAMEEVTSAYVMNRVQLDKLMFLAGVRAEWTSVNYDGNIVEIDAAGLHTATSPINKTNTYVNILPNVQVKYDLTSSSLVRAALTYGYSRPTFTQLVPGRIINIAGMTIEDGNPDLKPAFSTNFDLMFEKYLKNLGILSAGVFYKKIDEFQYRNVITLTGDEFEGATAYQGYRWGRTLNGDVANVYGVELNAQSNLTFLPGVLKGITVMANYTWAYSNADAQERKDLRLPGQAVNTANGSLSWAYKGFTIQGNLNFNDKYTMLLGANDDTDPIRDSRVQIDANSSYRINKHFTVYVEAVNLTNAPQRTFLGVENRIYGKQYYGTWGRMGVKFRL
ncbi:MAG: TonB-dependent receptor [Candidatus Pseudobacter hemicellulosilyticus]|uniref:TonB-dependent receptor n=1 Tax=Candidatus Pseudobacter hemicellulosilyticus TaxID=3121375 RepID=A0AAJ6BFE1_9BACT|nr:MAG: TonB-dependent receptor [Pseudobacter sp.]